MVFLHVIVTIINYMACLFFYYVELENEVNGNYIIMKMSEKETIEFSDGTRRGYICIPIIHLSQKPIFIGESD